jgi:hypothetical protein
LVFKSFLRRNIFYIPPQEGKTILCAFAPLSLKSRTKARGKEKPKAKGNTCYFTLGLRRAEVKPPAKGRSRRQAQIFFLIFPWLRL